MAPSNQLTQSDRLRQIGLAILVVGIVAAALYYAIEARGATPTADDLFPDAARDTDRQIGMMMGTFGLMMLGWSRALAKTGTQAILIAVAAAFAAFICFRVASVWDHNERVRNEAAARGDAAE